MNPKIFLTPVLLFISACTIEADVPPIDLSSAINLKKEVAYICASAYGNYLEFDELCESEDLRVSCEFSVNYQILCSKFLENRDGKLLWREDEDGKFY
jgi:hypothetical protein